VCLVPHFLQKSIRVSFFVCGIYPCVCVCIPIYIYTSTYICIHAYIHIYIYTCIHMDICIGGARSHGQGAAGQDGRQGPHPDPGMGGHQHRLPRRTSGTSSEKYTIYILIVYILKCPGLFTLLKSLCTDLRSLTPLNLSTNHTLST
jgi:hypothetical protein